MRKAPILSLLFAICISWSASVSAQTRSVEQKRRFQDEQRAMELVFYENDIRSLEDAPMRCFARYQIARFIYEKKVRDQKQPADSFSMGCLRETLENPKQFTSSLRSFWRSRTMSLLRIHAPEIAKRAEEKYVNNGDQDLEFSDLTELENSRNVSRIVSRALSKLQRGDLSSSIPLLVERLSKRDPDSAIVLLGAILSHYEAVALNGKVDTTLLFLTNELLAPSTPPELKKRFFRLSVVFGQRALIEPSNPDLFLVSRDMLRWGLPQIKTHLPDLYERALQLFATLNSKLSEIESEKEEVFERIDRSQNKLQQTIAEAERAETKDLKGELWMRAAKLALSQKRFVLAVDAALKISFGHEHFEIWRAQFLKRDILSAALKAGDFESSAYVVEKLVDSLDKSEALIEISSKYLEIKRSPAALAKILESLKLLRKVDDSANKVRVILSVIPVALKVEGGDPFGVALSSVKVINRLPGPAPEDRLETDGRRAYVAGVLLPTSFNIAKAFALLAERNTDLAYPIAQSIQRKDLRLVANIAIEVKKTHPEPWALY